MTIAVTQVAVGSTVCAVVDAARFPVRFTGANRAMAVLGLSATNSYVDVSAQVLTVRMGWAFRSAMPRSSVHSVRADEARVWGWGAHGWGGAWLVNGSSTGIVRIEFDPPGHARVLGVRVQLQILRVSVEDPEGLQRALEMR